MCIVLNCRRVTFICGQAGVCALGAVVARESGDEKLCHHYITQFNEVTLFINEPCFSP